MGRDRLPGSILTNRKLRAINRDVVVFTFFLVLSFCLWYINSLGKEAEMDIRYPVRFKSIPKERTMAGEIPDKLNFSLKGPGYSVLKLKLSGNRPPVMIDLSKVAFKRVPDSKDPDYYIVTSGLVKSLTVQIRSGCEILGIKPDTLFFSLDKETARSGFRKR